MPKAKQSTRTMSDEHKAALAAGRESGRAVRGYLDALEEARPKRGRKRTPESIRKRLDTVTEAIPAAAPLDRLSLIQERMDLTEELASFEGVVPDLDALEAAFVQHAGAYSERKGISYAAWRELGVTPAVLKKAGVTR